MEGEKVYAERTDWKFSKEVSGWGSEKDNYVIPHELTVTITLNEYRALIEGKMKAERAELSNKNFELQQKIQKLEKEVEALRSALSRCPKEEEDESV